MEGSKAPSHGLRSLLVAPAIEIQSHLCLGTCTPWKSPEEQAGSEDLGVQEVKTATNLVQQSWSPGGTPAAPPGPRLPNPAQWSRTLHHLPQQTNTPGLPREQRPGDAQPPFHPPVLPRASLPHQPKLWVAGEGGSWAPWRWPGLGAGMWCDRAEGSLFTHPSAHPTAGIQQDFPSAQRLPVYFGRETRTAPLFCCEVGVINSRW